MSEQNFPQEESLFPGIDLPSFLYISGMLYIFMASLLYSASSVTFTLSHLPYWLLTWALALLLVLGVNWLLS